MSAWAQYGSALGLDKAVWCERLLVLKTAGSVEDVPDCQSVRNLTPHHCIL